jgi:hypothetical protein
MVLSAEAVPAVSATIAIAATPAPAVFVILCIVVAP